MTVEWRRLHNEEHYTVYSSLHIIREIKSKTMRWAGNVARMGRGAAHTRLRWEYLKEGDHFEDLGVDGRIILK